MKHYFLGLLAVFTLFLTSCASQRNLTGDVQAVTARVDARIKAFNLDENANGIIKMKRGTGIQLSLTRFGIEGARVIFTPDSILFISKLSRTYVRTSYREADMVLGGEGALTFRNVEAFFWNDRGRNTERAMVTLAGIMPLELKTSYGRSIRVGQQHMPQRITLTTNSADGVVDTGEARIKFSKVKAANTWEPNTEVPAKYANLNFLSLVRKLLKK